MMPWFDMLSIWYRIITDSLCSNCGVEQMINGMDRVIVPVRLKTIKGAYEPHVWRIFMPNIKQGDIAVDIGAYIGVYSVAMARRVGVLGKVYAFEPDRYNSRRLQWAVRVNEVSGQVEIIERAVTSFDGEVSFSQGMLTASCIKAKPAGKSSMVACVRLDSFFSGQKIDILKIDVEGYEEDVIKGCQEMLSDKRRRPRCILIETHKFAWHKTNTTFESLLGRLSMYNCEYVPIDGIDDKVDAWYGAIICTAKD